MVVHSYDGKACCFNLHKLTSISPSPFYPQKPNPTHSEHSCISPCFLKNTVRTRMILFTSVSLRALTKSTALRREKHLINISSQLTIEISITTSCWRRSHTLFIFVFPATNMVLTHSWHSFSARGMYEWMKIPIRGIPSNHGYIQSNPNI